MMVVLTYDNSVCVHVYIYVYIYKTCTMLYVDYILIKLEK